MKITKTNKKNLLIVGIVTLALFVSFTSIQSSLQQEKQLIIGTWVSEEDNTWKIKFTKTGDCYWYSENVQTESFCYYMLNTIEGKNYYGSKYLKLVKKDKSIYNYYIHGVTKDGNDTYLSIEYHDKPRPMVFKKQ